MMSRCKAVRVFFGKRGTKLVSLENMGTELLSGATSLEERGCEGDELGATLKPSCPRYTENSVERALADGSIAKQKGEHGSILGT